MKRFLDTNICIAYLNGSDVVVRDRLLMLNPNDVLLPSIVKAELFFGARKSQRVEANLRNLQEFFNALQSVSFDDLAAAHYGLLRAQLEREGQIIGANDLLIAATALAHGAVLVTRNDGEFRRVAGLQLEIW